VISLFGDGPIGDQLRALDIPVEVLDLRPLFARKRFDRATRLLADRFRQHRPDIVEAHLTWSRLLALPAAWRAGVPVRIGFEQGDVYLDSWKFRLANFLGQVAAHRIIVCSEALADWNRRTHRIARSRLAVFHNCVDVARFDPDRIAPDNAPFDRPDCRTLFCAVGTLGGGVNKRVDVAIRAVAMARANGADVGLVIAGDGPQRCDLESLASELGVGSHTTFLGMRSDLPKVMAACDALCHAAPFEPFGIVGVEAMAMRLPVIVPDTGGMHEAVDDGVSGIVYPALDYRALAAAMGRLDAEPGLRAAMGAHGRETVVRRFSSVAYMERLGALYQALLAERQS
jgi:glycosyltransferase involved in cell wall biosynthesis